MKISIHRLKIAISRRLDKNKITQKIRKISSELSTLRTQQDMLLDTITELESEINPLFEKKRYRKKMLMRRRF